MLSAATKRRRCAGIPVVSQLTRVYVVSAVFAGFAGIVYNLRFTNGAANAGEALQLDSIAAVVIGGAPLFGGAGTVGGAMIARFIISVLENGLVIMAINPFWKYIAVGTVIIIAVLIDQARERMVIGRRRTWITRPAKPCRSCGSNTFKRFGGLTAVNDVSVDIYPGEVIGLVGDNGAGKSTLIKMISGVYRPDGGRIYLGEEEITLSSPMEARNLGIETIYQDLALCENLDATVNIFLGKEPLRRMLGIFNQVDRPHMLEESHKVLDRLDIKIPDLSKPIRQMSGGQRQAAIAALYWNAPVIMDDRPLRSACPNSARCTNWFTRQRQQRPRSSSQPAGRSTADRIVVMRRGSKVGDLLAQDTSGDELVSLMVGVD